MATTNGNDGGYTNPGGEISQNIPFSKPCGGNTYTVTYHSTYLEMSGPLGSYCKISGLVPGN